MEPEVFITSTCKRVLLLSTNRAILFIWLIAKQLDTIVVYQTDATLAIQVSQLCSNTVETMLESIVLVYCAWQQWCFKFLWMAGNVVHIVSMSFTVLGYFWEFLLKHEPTGGPSVSPSLWCLTFMFGSILFASLNVFRAMGHDMVLGCNNFKLWSEIWFNLGRLMISFDMVQLKLWSCLLICNNI